MKIYDMKRVFYTCLLALISLLFFGKTNAQSNIIGNPIKIGNIEVTQYDFRSADWDNAIKICSDLGEGWRLPTKDELITMFKYNIKIGNINTLFSYWTSEVSDDKTSALTSGFDAKQVYPFQFTPKYYEQVFRPVRNSLNNNENGLYVGEDQKKRNNLSVLRFTSYDCGELVKSINSKGKNPRYNNQPKLYADEVVGPTIGEYIVQHYSNATESEFKSLINQASECVSISLNNVKPNTQNSECLVIENTKKPNLNFTIIDNRELCICCREKYKRFVLSDLEDKKRNQEVQYLNARLEEHLSKSSADENHMQSDRAKLKGYIALNYGMIGLTGSVLVDVLSPLVDLFGGSTNKTSRDREIDKYRNVSDYCSKKCEILCSK